MRRRETKSARVMDWEPIPDDVLVPKRARRDGPKRPFPPDVTVVRQRDGMSLADRWGLPRTRGKRRRRAVVDDVSDSSDDDATSDDDEDTETPPNVAAVLAAHLSLGWKLDSSDCLVPPRRPGSSAGHTPELVEMRRAYGIDPGNKTTTTTSPGGRIGPRTRRCPRSWPRCRAPGSAAPFSNARTTAPSLSRRRRSRRRGSGAISIRCAGQGSSRLGPAGHLRRMRCSRA